MEIDKLVELMLSKPYIITQGIKKTASRTQSSVNEVIKAKRIVRKIKEGKEIAHYKTFPKILIFDIETSPLKAYVWRRWKQNIYLEQTISEWFMISWAAKWLYSNDVLSGVLTPEEVLKEDDKRIITELWELINEADIVVAHNGDKFDIPKMNSRFILNDLPPTKPYFSIDTKKVAATQFGFSSNKLDALAGYFNIPHKDDTDFELWVKCLKGNQEALNYMESYNGKDVVILEEVYLKLRPWIKNHPNVGNFMDLDINVCSNCGSSNVKEVPSKFYYTQVGKYPLYRCECGALSRGKKTVKSKEKNKVLVQGVGK